MTPGPDWHRYTALLDTIREDMRKATEPPYDFRPDRGDGSWTGSNYRGQSREGWPKLPPEPTFEERRQRCEAMGLVICSCRGVETERGRTLIYDVHCPIHHGERRR